MPILTFITDKIEVKNADLKSGNLIFKVLGIPFGGPEGLDGKDFQGQWFDSKTYVGTDLGVATIYATLDHNISTDMKGTKILSTDRSMIGAAKFVGVDDLGVWYELEVKRGEKYQEMLLDLYGKGYLFASSQPIQTTVEIEKSGYIKSWVPAEIALTTHAANPLAIVELAKSYDFEVELKEIPATTEEETQEVVPDITKTEIAPVAEKQSAETVKDAKDSSLEEFVNNAFDEKGEAEAETQPVAVGAEDVVKRLDVMDVTLKTIQTQISAYVDFWGPLNGDDEQTATVRELLAQMMTSAKSTNKGISNIEDGLRAFTEQVAKRLHMKVIEEAERLSDMSEAERDAEIEIKAVKGNRIFVNIPENAPGG